MRKPSPTTLFAAVSLALFAGSVLAQSRAPTTSRAMPGTNATAPANNTNVSSSSSSAQGNAQAINNAQGSLPTVVSTTQGVVAIGTPLAGAANLQGAQLVDSNGTPLADATGRPLILDGRGLVGVAPSLGIPGDSGIVVGTPDTGSASDSGNVQVMILNPRDLSAGSVTSTPELDRATLKELNKAKLASRSKHKQLLHTIAPRTNADRSNEMADDPLSPALSIPERPIPRY